jgi:hypothetical protein
MADKKIYVIVDKDRTLEHARGRNKTPRQVFCQEEKVGHRGWERLHRFRVLPPKKGEEGFDPILDLYLRNNNLMVVGKGKVYRWWWQLPMDIRNYQEADFHEAFRLLPSGFSARGDVHNLGSTLPPDCAVWGAAEISLSLRAGKWGTVAAREYAQNILAGEANSMDPDRQNRARLAREEAERGWAPGFAHNERPDLFESVDVEPTFDDILWMQRFPSYSGKLVYFYMPTHCGEITDDAILASPGLRATLNQVLRQWRTPTFPELLDLRSGNSGDAPPRSPLVVASGSESRAMRSVLETAAFPSPAATLEHQGPGAVLGPSGRLGTGKGRAGLRVPPAEQDPGRTGGGAHPWGADG